MIKTIQGGHKEKLKGVTKTWTWTKKGYIDEEGNPLKNNQDFSKVMKFSEIPKVNEK